MLKTSHNCVNFLSITLLITKLIPCIEKQQFHGILEHVVTIS
jgi:hypothetical protein